MNITVEVIVTAPIEVVWKAWASPDDISQWNAASDNWCCPSASNDLRVGGAFRYRMAARDGFAGFDFEGVYTHVVPQRRIDFNLGDALGENRSVSVEFQASAEGVVVRETFVAEDVHSGEQQRQGWQAILQRFKQHVEGSAPC